MDAHRSTSASTAAQRRPGRPRQLEIDDVVEAALELGLEGITLATVADHLGVGVATVYRCVNGLDPLRHLVLSRLVAAAPWPRSNASWRETLRGLSAGVAAVLNARPGVAEFCEPVAFEHPQVLEVFAQSVSSLVRDGFSTREAVIAVDLVMHLTFDTLAARPRTRSAESAEERMHALAHRLPAEISREARELQSTWSQAEALALKVTITIAGIEQLRASGGGLG